MATCVEFAPVFGPVIEDPAWDTGYSTGEFNSGDFYYAITANKNLQGAVVGVNTADSTPHFSDIAHGFIFSNSSVRIIENGVFVGPNWSPYNSDDLFTVMRIGTTIYYLRGFEYDYDTAVYYDDQLPGVPLPGNIMWVSEVTASAPLQLDMSIFGVNDQVCVIDGGVSWQAENGIGFAAGAVDGTLQFDIAAAGGFGASSGQLEGTLSLSLTDSLGTPEEGVTDGILEFDSLAGDITRNILTGELVFQGGQSDGSTGSGSIYYGELYEATRLTGYMQFTGFASGEEYYPEGVPDGTLPILLKGAGSDFIDVVYDAGLIGDLTFDIAGVGTPIADGIKSGAALELNFDIQGVGTEGATEATSALVSELTFDFDGTGSGYPDNKLITAVLDGQLDFRIAAVGTAIVNNYFQILLPELGGIANAETELSVEVIEEIRALSELQAKYVLLVNEFISLVTEPRTFSQQSVELLDTAYAVATALPQFSLWVQETLGITDTDKLTIVQVLELAESLQAASMVQTVYQGTVAVLSAILITDGGAGADPVGSGAILDATGVSGDPAEIALYGWFPTGSVLGISYTTNVGGGGSVSYTLTQHQTGEQVAERLVALLNAEPYLSSTYAGNGVVQILPANGATVVNI